MAHEYYSIYSDGDRHRYASAEFEHAKIRENGDQPALDRCNTEPDLLFIQDRSGCDF